MAVFRVWMTDDGGHGSFAFSSSSTTLIMAADKRLQGAMPPPTGPGVDREFNNLQVVFLKQ